MSERIGNQDDTTAHWVEIGYFNDLILDLKKRELGLQHEPITMERLNEASKHIRELFQCRKKVVFR